MILWCVYKIKIFMMYEGDNVVLYFSDAGLRSFAEPCGFCYRKMVVVPTVSMKRVICVKECHFQTHI